MDESTIDASSPQPQQNRPPELALVATHLRIALRFVEEAKDTPDTLLTALMHAESATELLRCMQGRTAPCQIPTDSVTECSHEPSIAHQEPTSNVAEGAAHASPGVVATPSEGALSQRAPMGARPSVRFVPKEPDPPTREESRVQEPPTSGVIAQPDPPTREESRVQEPPISGVIAQPDPPTHRATAQPEPQLPVSAPLQPEPPENAPVVAPPEQKNARLVDSFTRRPVLHESLARRTGQDKRLTGITSIKQNLTLNDRLRYAHELFGGDKERLSQLVQALDSANSLPEALEVFQAHYSGEPGTPAVEEFISLIERRFA